MQQAAPPGSVSLVYVITAAICQSAVAKLAMTQLTATSDNKLISALDFD